MKIAIISDIHGNLVALEAALAEIDRIAPDQIICLGDVFVTGPQPRGALARVRALGCPVVMGNTDEWALHPQPFTIRSKADQMLYDVELWGAQQLTGDDQDFIRTFQPTIEVDLGYGRSLLCFHGSPRSNTEIIRATTLDDELTEKLGNNRAAIFAGGHTHVSLLRHFQNSLILNPGSVGLPFVMQPDGRRVNPAWAEYALVEAGNGRLDITLRRVPYDLDALREAVAQSNMPHANVYLADWISGDTA